MEAGRPVLYGHFESGNVYKVALLLALLDETFEYRHVDLFGGETRAAAFREVNRFGEVPVLEHGDRRLVQSDVVLGYLAQLGGRFLPEGVEGRWRMAEWLAWDNHRLLPGLALLRFQRRFVADPDPAVVAFLEGRTVAALGLLDRELDGRSYLVGEGVTIADIACAGYMWFMDQAGLDPARWPHIAAWLGRLESLPGWKAPYDLLPRA